jgi:hypothetical protein
MKILYLFNDIKLILMALLSPKTYALLNSGLVGGEEQNNECSVTYVIPQL